MTGSFAGDAAGGRVQKGVRLYTGEVVVSTATDAQQLGEALYFEQAPTQIRRWFTTRANVRRIPRNHFDFSFGVSSVKAFRPRRVTDQPRRRANR
jgi:hypothetical protein